MKSTECTVTKYYVCVDGDDSLDKIHHFKHINETLMFVGNTTIGDSFLSFPLKTVRRPYEMGLWALCFPNASCLSLVYYLQDEWSESKFDHLVHFELLVYLGFSNRVINWSSKADKHRKRCNFKCPHIGKIVGKLCLSLTKRDRFYFVHPEIHTCIICLLGCACLFGLLGLGLAITGACRSALVVRMYYYHSAGECFLVSGKSYCVV
ncbi:uncharacterized protein DEA37_0005868 [Paragonimus westermani]|uniref:Uncharacterized protein n=1 Tax=Paragonimus westermani TaxID=34504 RepID=A0A5J4NHH5_9TREM|nr:uncharacterized protein DEA37_0005868 [Paragonimus westermani]